jgi:hypothetical protein
MRGFPVWRLSPLLCLCLWAAPAHAQTTVVVDITKAKLVWAWAQGNGGPVEKFNIKCGPTTGAYSILVSLPTPAARAIPISTVVTAPGTYFCVVSAANQFGESGNSNQVSFAAGVGPVTPSGLVIQAQ